MTAPSAHTAAPIAPPHVRTVLGLAGPVAVERLTLSVLASVDSVLVGRYVGADGVAAVGVSALFFWLPFAAASGMSLATTAVVARDHGAGRLEGIERSIAAALLLALGWGIISALLLSVAAGPLLRLMAVEPEVRHFGIRYVWAGAPSFPMLMVLYTCTGAMRGLGNTWLPMMIAIALDVVKTVITFLLISGVIGVELNVAASGIGTSIAGSLGGLVAFVVLLRGIEGVQLRAEHALALGRREIGRLLNIGLPTMLEEFQFMIAFLVYSRVISGLGTASLAAHTIALRALDGALVPGFALGAAGTTLVSRYLGAGRADLAERAARMARTYAVGTMVVMAALLALLAPQLVSIFVDDPDVVDTGTKLLRILAIAFPFMGLHASLSGALRGAGDVRYVLGVLTVTAWLVRIPFALLFALGFGWGAPGAWLGATLENSVRGLLIWRRFEQGTWKEKVV